MRRRLTIRIDEDLYRALHDQVGRRHLGGFIEDSVRPRLLCAAAPEEGYRAMAGDEERERAALACSEALIGETLA